MACEEKMSSRQTRELVRKYKEGLTCNDGFLSLKYTDSNGKEKRVFDKSIIVLKIAMHKLGAIMESIEDDNWTVHEILMEHKNMLNSQIDILIKQKKKLM
jgi:ParB family chromosome partitioning protein